MNNKTDKLLSKHIESQKKICAKYNSNFNDVNLKLYIGVNSNLELEPINGLRHPKHGKMSEWYIWSGEWSDDDNFFEPLCLEHFIEKKPDLIKYLGLDIGFRFLTDKKGYEDVWFDKNIIELK